MKRNYVKIVVIIIIVALIGIAAFLIVFNQPALTAGEPETLETYGSSREEWSIGAVFKKNDD